MNNKYKLSVINAISFLDLFAIGLMFPLLQPHVRELGASHFTVGLLGSSYAALQVLTGPLIGSWSDIRGRRSVLTITLSICAICYFLLGLTNSIGAIFLLRCILGFLKHTQTICKALIADLLPVEQRAQAYGQSSGLAMLGFVIGPVLGGHISELNNGFFYVCCLTCLLFIGNIVLSIFLPETKKKENNDTRTLRILPTIHRELLRSITDLRQINWRVHSDTFLIRFLFAISVSIFHSNQAIHLKEKYNLSQVHVGYTISFLSIISVITGLGMGKITTLLYPDDHDCLKRIYHSFCTIALCSVGFYFAPDIYVYYAILVPFAMVTVVLRIVTMELMLSRSASDEKGSLSGASNSVMSIARFVTPVTSGLVGDLFGQDAVILCGGVPTLWGAMLTMHLMKKNKVKTN